MGIEINRELFDSRGLIRRPHVYMLVAYDECCGEFAFIKFGYSIDAYARAAGLRTACPLKWLRYTIIECTNQRVARDLEHALLNEFKDDSCGGEWVKVRWMVPEVRKDILARTMWAVRALIITTPSIIEVDPAIVVWAQNIKTKVNRKRSTDRGRDDRRA